MIKNGVKEWNITKILVVEDQQIMTLKPIKTGSKTVQLLFRITAISGRRISKTELTDPDLVLLPNRPGR